jgi:predicted adenylyl cyclase CyaB
MAQEIEIKLRIDDVDAFRRKLERLGAQPVAGNNGSVHEWNVIFDTPQSDLVKRGQLLRIRTETPARVSVRGEGASRRVILTFKRPVEQGKEPAAEHYKVREELELEVAEAGMLARIFEGLGMRGWFRYEKYRTKYQLAASVDWAKGLLIELDETPIGTFVELEGLPEAIDRAAEELGFSMRDYILTNYLSLYLEDCKQKGIEPRDMVFPGEKNR